MIHLLSRVTQADAYKTAAISFRVFSLLLEFTARPFAMVKVTASRDRHR